MEPIAAKAHGNRLSDLPPYGHLAPGLSPIATFSEVLDNECRAMAESATEGLSYEPIQPGSGRKRGRFAGAREAHDEYAARQLHDRVAQRRKNVKSR